MKYKIRKDLSIHSGDTILYRIERLSDGLIGGYVESESNLSQKGNCWVGGDAKVYGEARVFEDAQVYGEAIVFDGAEIFGNPWVFGDARVCGNSKIYNNAQVYGNAEVFDNARVYGFAKVYENAEVYDNAEVFCSALVYGSAKVFGKAQIFGNSWVFGDARVCGNAKVSKYGECVVINNLKHTITCMPNRIQIGCETWQSFEEFEKNYQEIFKKHNYTGKEIEITYLFVKAAMMGMETKPKTIKLTHEGREFEIDVEKAKELGILK